MTQAVWSTAHGRPLDVTELGGDQISRLGAHVDPILVLFTPLWWVWPSPAILLVVQAAIVALGALPFSWLGRKHLGSEWAGTFCGLAYLVYPAVQWLALDEFHPVALACPLLAYAVWYLDEERLWAFAPFALLAALTKEEIPLVLGALGIWYALGKGHRLAGAAIALAGVTATALSLEIVMPHFREGANSAFYGRYETVGGSPAGIVKTAFTDPLAVLAAVADRHDLAYVAELVLPLAGLVVLAPLVLLAAVPELLANVLSSVSNQTSIRFHYTAPIAPFLLAAAVMGIARLERSTRAAAVLLAASALGALVVGPLRTGELAPDRVSNHDRIAARALALIPSSAAVSSTNGLGAHLSERRRIHTFPVVLDSEWVAVDLKRASYLDLRSDASTTAVPLGRLLASPWWRTVFEEDGIIVLRRTAARAR